MYIGLRRFGKNDMEVLLIVYDFCGRKCKVFCRSWNVKFYDYYLCLGVFWVNSNFLWEYGKNYGDVV